jgi:hypothetical protein
MTAHGLKVVSFWREKSDRDRTRYLSILPHTVILIRLTRKVHPLQEVVLQSGSGNCLASWLNASELYADSIVLAVSAAARSKGSTHVDSSDVTILDVTPCNVVVHRCLEGTHCFHLQNRKSKPSLQIELGVLYWFTYTPLKRPRESVTNSRRSLGSSVGTVMGNGLDSRRSILRKETWFFSSPWVPERLWDIFLGAKVEWAWSWHFTSIQCRG